MNILRQEFPEFAGLSEEEFLNKCIAALQIYIDICADIRVRSTVEGKVDAILSLLTTKGSAVKGRLSEISIWRQLCQWAGENNVKDTSKIPRSGDFLVHDKIMIEVKDYKSAVPRREVDKFLRDVLEGPAISGIFVSLGPKGICGINGYNCRRIGGKFLIFIAEKPRLLLGPSLEFLHNFAEKPALIAAGKIAEISRKMAANSGKMQQICRENAALTAELERLMTRV